jgi:hypothetical protein
MRKTKQTESNIFYQNENSDFSFPLRSCWVSRSFGLLRCLVEKLFSRSFEETYGPPPLGSESIHGLATLKIKAVRSCETSRSNYPSTWRGNPEDFLCIFFFFFFFITAVYLCILYISAHAGFIIFFVLLVPHVKELNWIAIIIIIIIILN